MQAMAGSSREHDTPSIGSKHFLNHLTAILLGMVAIVVLLSTNGQAQAFMPSGVVVADTPLPTFSKDVQEVSLVLTVTNKRGKFVRDLHPTDLSILDNDLPPEKITFFQSETDLPLRVALVIDTSDSVMNRFMFEQRAAEAFLKKILRPKSDFGVIIGFNQHVRVAQGETNDFTKLR